jgi:hypothetical protein
MVDPDGEIEPLEERLGPGGRQLDLGRYRPAAQADHRPQGPAQGRQQEVGSPLQENLHLFGCSDAPLVVQDLGAAPDRAPQS